MTAPLRRLLVATLVVLAAATGATGAERYGWLGVRIRDLSEVEMEDLSMKLGVREGYGVMVAEIIPETPAQAAGLRAGDLIVSIDARPVVETRTLQRLVGATPAGRELRLVVLREGRRRELRVRVGQMPADVTAERIAAEFGFLVREPAPDDTVAADGPKGRPALVVAFVAERSAAARGGLLRDDRILGVNGTDVPSLDAFRRALLEVSLGDALRLGVERKGEPLTLVLPPAQPAALPH